MSRPVRRRPTSLRGYFLLVIVVGMGIPIAILGPWIVRGATPDTSGEILQARLQRLAAALSDGLETRWAKYEGALLDLATDSSVIAALAAEGSRAGQVPQGGSELEARWEALDGVVTTAVFSSRSTERLRLTRDARGRPAGGTAMLHIPVEVPVRDPASRDTLGWMRAVVTLAVMTLPLHFVPGMAAAARVGRGYRSEWEALTDMPIEPRVLASPGFSLHGREWLVARDQLPAFGMEIAVAAPRSVLTEPVPSAPIRRILAFLAVVTLWMAASALVAHRLSSTLERMVEGAQEVLEGRLDRAFPERGPDEIRWLGGALNAMTGTLRETLTRLAQRESVAAVGEFAASLAHEVRNPLTSIRLDLERAQERLDDPARARELLVRALAEIERLDSTVTGSLRIARSGSLAFAPTDLRLALAAARDAALPALAARNARLLDGSQDVPVIVHGNAGALEQLFLNLLLNAADAVRSSGTVRISVGVGESRAYVSIQDDGFGIPFEALARIYEPFFTTKEDGTGLGLPIAQRIAQAHGGTVRIESVAGKGTTAVVTLPRTA